MVTPMTRHGEPPRRPARSRQAGPAAATDGVRALAILQQASDLVAGTGCDCSTECCRFGVTGREPWVTRAEWDVIVAAVRRQGRRLPVVDDGDDRDDDEGRCPFLAVDDADPARGRCRIYDARPLGCRTFFCERAVHADGRRGRLPTPTLRALRPLAGDLAMLAPGTESRPLRSWLRSA
jgi:hypothetical protein